MVLVQEVAHPPEQLLQLLGVTGADVVDVRLELLDLGVDGASRKRGLAFVATPAARFINIKPKTCSVLPNMAQL